MTKDDKSVVIPVSQTGYSYGGSGEQTQEVWCENYKQAKGQVTIKYLKHFQF